MRVYLAGPDVFLPDPTARAAALKAVCARHGLIGVSPLDEMSGSPPDWGSMVTQWWHTDPGREPPTPPSS